MKLKQLIISGFKSFAEKTIFEFDKPLTAIVGPNGCGKSNIVDAFRWVMGEQSARSIRGDKMLDVIFSGSEKRKALSVAEVSLVFSNEKGILPIDYQEVCITRRIYRSGESQYLINKNEVRLKDIESLFWDTGLGKDAFCIFEQGKIDEVINQTPLERRGIFEEASGILRFKQRRKETLKRMEAINANLTRASDIYQMVVKHKDTLEKQAEVAKIFEVKKRRLLSLEKHLLFLKWQQANKKNLSDNKKLQDTAQEITKIECKRGESLLKLEEDKTSIEKQENEIKTLKETFFEKKNLKNLKTQELKSIEEQKDDIKSRTKLYELKLAELKEKKAKNLKQFVENQKETFVSTEDFQKVESSLKDSQKVVWEKRKVQADYKNEQKILQEDRIKLINEESKLKGRLQEIKLSLKTSEERFNYLNIDKTKLFKQQEEQTLIESEKKKAFEVLNKEVSSKQKEVASIDAEIQILTKAIKEFHDKERELQKKQGELLAKKKFLNNLKLDFEGVSKASKRLMQESKQTKSELFGLIKPLYELVKPKKGQENAFAFAMRLYEDTLVVDEANFEKVINYAKREKLKGFSIIGSCEKDVKTFFASYFTNSFEVIEEGVLKDLQGVVFFCDQSEKNPFLREVELQKVDEELLLVDTAVKAQEAVTKEKVLALEETKAKKNETDKALRQLEMKLVEVNFALQRAIGDKKRLDEQLQKIEKEIQENSLKIENFQKDLLGWSKNEEAISKNIEEKNKRYESLEIEIKSLDEVLQKVEIDFRQVELEFKKLQESRFRHKQLEELFNASNKEHEFLQKQLSEEKESILLKTEALEKSLQLLLEEKKSLDDDLVSFEANLALKVKAKDEFFLVFKNKEEALKKIDEELKVFQNQYHRLELILVETQSQLKSYHENALNEYQEDVQALNLKEEGSVLSLQNEINELKVDALNYANVNLGAIEEFEKQKEQEKLLREQLQDLTASKEEILEILKKLDNESRKLFIDTFQKIRENFKKNFQILFQGGMADLVFVEGQDPLEAGIEIQVQPPGKQMRSIVLLSGGEKCLTSLALLFALFEVKPSAFCLLDEVDAPLDEVNVEKFTRIIQQFAKDTQFVVVTHNKRTMKAADVLLGVSMEEKGVSKLLALAFEKEEVLC
jgi:chromosome segregation protein